MAIKMWAYGHSDWKYIKAIHKLFGTSSLKRYPHYNFFDLCYWTFIRKIEVVSILNYIEYKKEDVMKVIQDKLDWVYYGGKHYESVYTRFYQGYVLPTKFNIDKRKGHLSDLISSGQLTRGQALEEIKKEGYSKELFDIDKPFVLKKLELTEEEFQKIMDSEPKTFMEYPNNATKVEKLKKIVNFLRLKGFYSK
jgi:hypothetical protein